MSKSERTSPWIWVAVGCGGILVLGGVLLTILAFMGYSWVQDLEQSMQDPELRAQRVNEILKCQRLPDGYHPVMGLTIPFLIEFAMLSDEEQEDPQDPSFRERGFVFVSVLSPESDRKKLRDFLRGERRNLDLDNVQGLSIRSREFIGRGTLELEGASLLYASYRGGLRLEHASPEGISSLILFDCPPRERMKLGIWFGPDPDPERPVEELELAGTAADEEAMLDFVRHFAICRPE